MTDKEKLHIIVNGIHHSKSATRDYILTRMYNVYCITYPRTNRVLNECIEDGSLLPDSRNGFMSIESPEFDPLSNTEKSSLRKRVEFWGWIGGILGGVAAIAVVIDLYLKYFPRHK